MTGMLPLSEAILPLGRLPVHADGTAAELRSLNHRALLDWAIEEAVQAGVSLILLVADPAYVPATALLAHARRLLQALSLRPGQAVPQVELHIAIATGPEGWDGLIRQAAAHCSGGHALLIDPTMPLLRGHQVVTYAAFMLRSAAVTLPMGQALLAHAELPWERALALPVMVSRGGRLRFRFDRCLRGERIIVFAGRALLPLPLPPVEDMTASGWPAPYRFPFESLVRLLLALQARGYPLDFEPVEHPDSLPVELTPARAGQGGQPLVLFAKRAGLAALSVRP